MPSLWHADQVAPVGRRIASNDLLVPALPGRPDVTRVDVVCRPASDGWSCAVEVIEAGSRSRHDVAVRGDDLARLDSTAADPTDLVRRSFEFLLAREPKESILTTFDLTVISRYFPDYERQIRRQA